MFIKRKTLLTLALVGALTVTAALPARALFDRGEDAGAVAAADIRAQRDPVSALLHLLHRHDAGGDRFRALLRMV